MPAPESMAPLPSALTPNPCFFPGVTSAQTAACPCGGWQVTPPVFGEGQGLEVWPLTLWGSGMALPWS